MCNLDSSIPPANVTSYAYCFLRFTAVFTYRTGPNETNIQARGLDVIPTTISRFRNGNDHKTADLLESVVYPEEITHCAAGVRWFKYLCCRSENDESRGEEADDDGAVIQKFHSIVRTHFRGPLKPPFNVEARRAAGFGPQWYEPLATKDAEAA